MTPDEVRAHPAMKNESDFAALILKLGGDYRWPEGPEELARDFAQNPGLDGRLSYLLKMPSEAEKLSRSAVRSASAAERSANRATGATIAAWVAAAIALAALAVEFFRNQRQ